MRQFLNRFIQVILHPDSFFERIRTEKNWTMPLLQLAVLALRRT
jgi:hypothetical protein